MENKKTTDVRVTEHEAKLVDRPAGTPLQELSADAFRALAASYFDWERGHALDAKYYGQYGSYSYSMFVAGRLETLAALMGEEAFAALAAEKHTEWVRCCAAEDAALRALAPCTTCGRSRDLGDEMNGSPLCGECGSEKWQREHPSISTRGDGDIPLVDDDLPF